MVRWEESLRESSPTAAARVGTAGAASRHHQQKGQEERFGRHGVLRYSVIHNPKHSDSHTTGSTFEHGVEGRGGRSLYHDNEQNWWDEAKATLAEMQLSSRDPDDPLDDVEAKEDFSKGVGGGNMSLSSPGDSMSGTLKKSMNMSQTAALTRPLSSSKKLGEANFGLFEYPNDDEEDGIRGIAAASGQSPESRAARTLSLEDLNDDEDLQGNQSFHQTHKTTSPMFEKSPKPTVSKGTVSKAQLRTPRTHSPPTPGSGRMHTHGSTRSRKLSEDSEFISTLCANIESLQNSLQASLEQTAEAEKRAEAMLHLFSKAEQENARLRSELRKLQTKHALETVRKTKGPERSQETRSPKHEEPRTPEKTPFPPSFNWASKTQRKSTPVGHPRTQQSPVESSRHGSNERGDPPDTPSRGVEDGFFLQEALQFIRLQSDVPPTRAINLARELKRAVLRISQSTASHDRVVSSWEESRKLVGTLELPEAKTGTLADLILKCASKQEDQSDESEATDASHLDSSSDPSAMDAYQRFGLSGTVPKGVFAVMRLRWADAIGSPKGKQWLREKVKNQLHYSRGLTIQDFLELCRGVLGMAKDLVSDAQIIGVFQSCLKDEYSQKDREPFGYALSANQTSETPEIRVQTAISLLSPPIENV